MDSLLKITDLEVEVEGKKVLKGVNLEISKGQKHAIMGPNGSGKSSLCFALMGHPKYKIVNGKIEFAGTDVAELATDKRAALGLFLSFQYPQEIPGITLGNFLRQAANLRNKAKVGPAEFYKIAQAELAELGMDKRFIGRGVNQGFSGGEKKKSEIAQLSVLKPKLAMLDEIDSGLDIDALQVMSERINKIQAESEMSMLLITHYQRLLHYIKVDYVHVMVRGRLVDTGNSDLVSEIESDGYKKYL